MTKEQIQVFKDTLTKKATRPDGRDSTLAKYMVLQFDGNYYVVTTRDFVVFDDANEMVYCVAINDNMNEQASYPFKLTISTYACLQNIDAVFSISNFTKFLDEAEGFFTTAAGEDRVNLIKKWAEGAYIQAQQPIRPSPYYPTRPPVDQLPHNYFNSDWYKIVETEPPVAPNSVISITTPEAFTAALKDLPEGSSIVLGTDTVITEAVELTKSISIAGGTINAPIKIADTAKNVTLKNVKMNQTDGTEIAGGKKAFILAGASESVTIKDCTFNMKGEVYAAINVLSPTCTIDGNEFVPAMEDGETKPTHNCIEFFVGDAHKIKSATISNNVFKAGCCDNNCIGLYDFEDKASVRISNNVYEFSGNAIRISNKTKASDVSIVCSEDAYRKTFTKDDEENFKYAGYMLFQASDGEDFSKMTVLINDLMGPGRRMMTKNGVGEDQVYYTYGTETVPNVIFS